METALPCPDSGYFAENRIKFFDKLSDNTIAVLFSGTPKQKSADLYFPFYANRNFYYLTGITREESVLIVKKHRGKIIRLILFIRAGDPMAERWTGKRLKPEQASAISGIYDVLYTEGYEAILRGLLKDWKGTVSVDREDVAESSHHLLTFLAEEFPQMELHDVYPILAMQRMYKTPLEITLIEEAIRITNQGIEQIYRYAKPGMKESDLAAEFECELRRQGADGIAFDSIVATGDNFNYLHYPELNSLINPGDMILLDVGASYCAMTADISRAFPVNGKFSPTQKMVYSMVRICQEKAFSLIRPGALIKDINDACMACAGELLYKAGIIHSPEDISKHYWHCVSHHMGLDVHDICGRTHALEAGMVITVEPGIYIPELNTGLRIEDDVLVTEDGCRVLSAHIPREADDIERLVAELRKSDNIGKIG